MPAELLTRLQVFNSVFFGIFFEAMPFLVIGVLGSGFLHVWVSDTLLLRWMPRHVVVAALLGSVLGMVFPVCECGVVAVSRRLLSRGAPLPLAVAFMMAGSVVNPIVLGSTWIAFDGNLTIVAGRVGLVLLAAIAVALFVGLHDKPFSLLRDRDHETCTCHDHGPDDRRLGHVISSATVEFLAMSKFLVIAALIAALFQVVVPRSLLTTMADNSILSVVSMMLLAVLLSVCSTVDAFVALPFSMALGPAPVIAFLAFGPMVNFKSTLMYLNVLRPSIVVLAIAVIFQLVFLGASLLNMMIG